MINPVIYIIPDQKNMDEMIYTVHTLVAAYFLTDDPKYSSKAADLLCHAAVQYPKNSSLYAQIYRSLVDDRPFFDSHNLPCMNR